ncbi:helix-turn-helix domain-containing protein [Embleya sp. NBC_00896]|uniref:helix-turn-helix domain-containing protein n=1 Tax=Embleya sp. NBC_00896 TaxID=2975961 RepID=UPI0038667A58|nr:helix-turn-helix transcriptional regulator [Embleya sp. NBC_00896]
MNRLPNATVIAKVAPAPLWAEFGRTLRTRRRLAGMTQQQLGLRVGYHHSLISKLEAGLREPPAGLPRRLDDLLDTGGDLSALLTSRSAPPPVLHRTHFSVIPGGETPAGLAPLPDRLWPARLPDHGLPCPLHGNDGCDVPTYADALKILADIGGREPVSVDPDVVHVLTALLGGYTRAGLEGASTGLIGSVEYVLRRVVGWAEALNAHGRSPHTQLRLAADYAQLAGRFRMQQGQSVIGMAWFDRGLNWADVCESSGARASLLADVCTLARLDGDATAALAYAHALEGVDTGRAWVATLAQLYQARARALGGDPAECRRHISLAHRHVTRFDERDRTEAPWLTGLSGRLRMEANIGGALRDLAARTGDLSAAHSAVRAVQAALDLLPMAMRPARVLLTVRLADAFACAGRPDAAVVAATPVIHEAGTVGTAAATRELLGLRRRLTRQWSDLPEVRNLLEQMPGHWPAA